MNRYSKILEEIIEHINSTENLTEAEVLELVKHYRDELEIE